MKESKMGNETFYFTDSSCNQLDPFDIELLGTIKTGEKIQLDWSFKSKNEAIDAMIKQLEGMKK